MRRKVKVVYSERKTPPESLKRRIFTKEFKRQILREVQAGKPIAQAARELGLHPNLIGP